MKRERRQVYTVSGSICLTNSKYLMNVFLNIDPKNTTATQSNIGMKYTQFFKTEMEVKKQKKKIK